MKVFHLPHCYSPASGRVEKWVQEVSERLARRGHQVEVYTSNGMNLGEEVSYRPPFLLPEETTIAGVKVKRFSIKVPSPFRQTAYKLFSFLPFWGDYFFLLGKGPCLPNLLPYLRRRKADVIMAAAFPLLNMWYAWRLARLTHTPLVFFPAFRPQKRALYDRPLFYRLLKGAQAVVVGTSRERDFLLKRGVPEKLLHGIGCGIEPQAFSGSFPRLRHHLHIPEEAVVVLFAGRKLPQEGIFTLIRAMPLVWQRFPQTYFVLAGTATIYNEKIKEMVAALEQNKGKVILLGTFSQKEKASLFSLGNIFVYPSREDYLSPLPLEAWASSKPVVGCYEGALGSVISEGEDGLLFPFGQALDLACALTKLIKSALLRDNLGRQGRLKVLSHYSWEVITSQLEKMYFQLVESRGESDER